MARGLARPCRPVTPSATCPTALRSAVQRPRGRAHRAPPQLLGALWHLRDGVLVVLHLARDPVVRVAVGDLQVVDDQAAAGEVPAEVLGCLQRRQLFVRTVDLHVSGDVHGRIQKDDVEALDTAVLLHLPVQPDRLVEVLERRYLAPAYDLAPADAQDPISHAHSSRYRLGSGPEPVRPTLPGRASRCKAAFGPSRTPRGARAAPARSTAPARSRNRAGA